MKESKISWAEFRENGKKIQIYHAAIDEDLYNQKYRGKLFCINGCIAKMKFTHRKDGLKFFSTWNKDGALHNEDCPYHVNYQNEIGRKILEALYLKQPLNNNHIKMTIRNKFLALKEKLPVEDDEKTTTNRVRRTGKDTIPVYSDDGSTTDEYIGRIRVGSLDARLITKDYINLRKCVFGVIKSVYMDSTDSGNRYLYLNMESKINFSIYFTVAFYSAEHNSLEDFLKFYDSIKKLANQVKG